MMEDKSSRLLLPLPVLLPLVAEFLFLEDSETLSEREADDRAD
jgi:hypothetical protein